MKPRKMDDNELALRIIATVLSLEIKTSKYKHGFEKSTYIYDPYFNSNKRIPNKGDVAIACTSGYVKLNQFTIGEIAEVIEGGLRIRDFKTGRLCDCRGEEFLCIERDGLGFKWKFGMERKVYDILLAKWCEEDSWLISYEFSFEDNHLRWSVRKQFTNDEFAVVEFDADDDMTAEQIADKAFDMMVEKQNETRRINERKD